MSNVNTAYIAGWSQVVSMLISFREKRKHRGEDASATRIDRMPRTGLGWVVGWGRVRRSRRIAQSFWKILQHWCTRRHTPPLETRRSDPNAAAFPSQSRRETETPSEPPGPSFAEAKTLKKRTPAVSSEKSAAINKDDHVKRKIHLFTFPPQPLPPPQG